MAAEVAMAATPAAAPPPEIFAPNPNPPSVPSKTSVETSNDGQFSLRNEQRVQVQPFQLPQDISRPDCAAGEQASISARAYDEKFHSQFSRAKDYRFMTHSEMLCRFTGTAFEHSVVPAAIAVCISVLAVYLKLTYPETWSRYAFNHLGHVQLVVPTAFLLVVRTTLSYHRWWFGRLGITKLVGHSRNLCSKSMWYLIGPNAKPAQQQITQYVCTMYVCVRHNLVKRSANKRGDPTEYSGYVTPEELKILAEMKRNRPVSLVNWLRRTLVNATTGGALISEEVLTSFEHDIRGILQAWQSCSTLCTTPLPFPYAHLLKFLLCTWVFTLPFALTESLDNFMAVPLISGLFAVAFFGIDGIGEEIEDPFGSDFNDIPLEQIEVTLREDLGYITGGMDIFNEKYGQPVGETIPQASFKVDSLRRKG